MPEPSAKRGSIVRNRFSRDGSRLCWMRDPRVTLGNNKQLPAVAQMPKSLDSDGKFQVVATVNGGLTDPGIDVVLTVYEMKDGAEVPSALGGLIDKPVGAVFFPDRKEKVRRTLLSAQLTNKSLTMTVEWDRAFRASDWPV